MWNVVNVSPTSPTSTRPAYQPNFNQARLPAQLEPGPPTSPTLTRPAYQPNLNQARLPAQLQLDPY